MNEQIPEWLKQEAERKYPELFQQCNGGHHEMYGMCDVNFYERQAYIAGVLSRSGGVWVKASERLPETDGMVFVRNITTRHGGMIHTNELAKMEDLFNVEWLDESPAADKGDAIEFAEWIRDNNYRQSGRNLEKWYEFPYNEYSRLLTTTELYELFHQSK